MNSEPHTDRVVRRASLGFAAVTQSPAVLEVAVGEPWDGVQVRSVCPGIDPASLSVLKSA